MIFEQKIRELIGKGQTEESIDQLLLYVQENNEALIDQIILIKSRFEDLKREINSGLIDSEKASIKKAKINDALLRLNNDISYQPPPKISIDSKSNFKIPALYLIAGLCIFIILGNFIFKNIQGTNQSIPTSFSSSCNNTLTIGKTYYLNSPVGYLTLNSTALTNAEIKQFIKNDKNPKYLCTLRNNQPLKILDNSLPNWVEVEVMCQNELMTGWIIKCKDGDPTIK